MHSSIRNKLLIGAGIALILLGVAAWLAYRNAAQAAATADDADYVHKVLAATDGVLSGLDDANVHRCAYLRNGGPTERELCEAAAGALPGGLDVLRRLTVDDAEQRRRVDDADEHLGRLRELLGRSLRIRGDVTRRFNDRAQLALTDDLKATEAAARGLLAEVKTAAGQRLTRGNETTRAAAGGTMAAVDAGNLLALLVVGAVVVGVRRDFVAWRKSETARREQLCQLERFGAVGRLTSGVAHDFNNLLTVVTTGCEATLHRLAPDDPNRECLAVAVKACEKAAALSRRVLSLGRKTPTRPAPLDLNAVASDMHRMLRRLAGDGVTVELSLDPELRPAVADAVRVEQMLLNLVVNARDASPAGGRVCIETHNAGAEVMLAVSDGGCGMDGATKKRLFEPFFTTKAEGQGTGMGMAVVQEAVRECKGRIEVNSAPGRGTAVRVYLPAA